MEAAHTIYISGCYSEYENQEVVRRSILWTLKMQRKEPVDILSILCGSVTKEDGTIFFSVQCKEGSPCTFDVKRGFVVGIHEYEKSWGNRLEETRVFDTEEEANTYIDDYNKDNTLDRVPDIYWVAKPYNYERS